LVAAAMSLRQHLTSLFVPATGSQVNGQQAAGLAADQPIAGPSLQHSISHSLSTSVTASDCH